MKSDAQFKMWLIYMKLFKSFLLLSSDKKSVNNTWVICTFSLHDATEIDYFVQFMHQFCINMPLQQKMLLHWCTGKTESAGTVSVRGQNHINRWLSLAFFQR